MNELRIRVLGDLDVEGLPASGVGSRKGRTLVKVLALARGRPVSADRLADCLWDVAQPEHQLSVLVSRLRKVVGADRVVRTEGGYALRVDWLDLDALAELVEEGRRRLTNGMAASARAAIDAALALDRGPLLPDDLDADWARIDRALAERLLSEARRIGAAAALAAGDHGGAALLAERSLDHDPYDEAALRTLMTALVGSGRPASALAVYADMRSRLAENLGVNPAPGTEALHTAVLLGQPVGPATTPSGGRPAEDNRPIHSGAAPAGREAAVAALDAALARTQEGYGQLVVVEGEAGMGKSLLLAAWAQRARAAGTTVFMGHCDELARDLPLQPVLDALDDHLRAAGALSGSAEELLGADAELLAPLLSWSAQPRPATPALSVLREQGTGQALLFGALADVFSRFGQPAAVILDDVHLAGPATLEWLQLAARRAARRPLLLIAAQRREEAVPLPAATRIDLAPFDLAAAVAVVGEERAADLLERSHGNPLFLVELAAHLDAASLDASPPEKIRAAVSARCDRAGPAAATLRLAAVLGSDVDLDLLVTILRGRPVEVLDHLEEGVRRGFLVERGNAFSFRHELIRTALEAGASASRRALAHREAARALAARPQGDPLTVAYHGRMGGDDNLTASALVDAAGLASARFDQEEALRLLARSLDLRDSLPARLLRAKVGIMVGDYEGALADVEAAVDQGGGARALELGAWAAHYQRDFTAAARLADEGANVATSPAEKAGCLTIGGWVRQCAGDLPGAEARLVAATDCAPASWRAVSGLWLGGLRVHQGRTTQGVALIRPAIVKDAVAAQAHPLAHANLFAALGLAQLGRAEEALAAAKELDRPDAPARWAGRAANVRGWILRNLGESAAADESNSAGLAEATAAGMVEAMSHAHLDLGAGLLAAGDLDGATARVDASLALGDSHALAWRHRMRARLYQGEIALGQGDAGAAIASAQVIQREATEMGVRRYVTLAQLLAARGRLAAGEPVDLDVIQTALDRLDEVAGLEAWWLTAALAQAADVTAWVTLAERRVAHLAGHAGPYAGTLVRTAGRILETMRITGRNG